jgi:hypothetical protein
MHPQVHKDGPGACPICGMDLIKKVVDDTGCFCINQIWKEC